MKGAKALSLLLIVAFIVSSVSISGVIALYEPPSTPPSIWLWASEYNVTAEDDLTGTKFNITVNLYNVTWLGAIDFRLWYNTTLLDATTTYLSPMSTSYLGDYVGAVTPYSPTAPINNTGGFIRWAAIARDLYNPFSGNASLLIIEFKIDTAPPRGYAPPDFITYSCSLQFNETTLGWINPTTLEMGEYVLDTDYGLDAGLYRYCRPQMIPGAPEADFTWSPTLPRECSTVTLHDTSYPGEGAYLVSWKWVVTNDTGEAVLTGPDDAPETTMHVAKAGYVYVTLNVTNNVGGWNIESKTIEILMAPGRTTLFVHPSKSMVEIGETFKIGVIVNNVVDLYSFGFKLGYNSTILDVTKVWVMWPDFYSINETTGVICVSASCPYPYPFSGNGTLAAITFTAKEFGSCVLDLCDTTLVDFYAMSIAHGVVDGYAVVMIHDVAIVNVAPSATEAYPSWNINIIVTVKNEGTQNETFWVSVYYNLTETQWTIIGNQTVTDLAAGAEKLVTFIWNTTDVPTIIVDGKYGIYKLNATASAIPGEFDTGDNVLVDGAVRFRLLGDVDGNTVVNVMDLLLLKIAVSLGKTVAEKPFCDLDFNNVIDVMDLLVLKIIVTLRP